MLRFHPVGSVLVLETLNSTLESVKHMSTRLIEIIEAFLERIQSRYALVGLYLEVDANLARMRDRIAAEYHVRVLHDHVAKRVRQCVILVVYCECARVVVCAAVVR